ncbi:MAG: sulfatase-like hydrolase/transferase [Fuerstiella sp.]|nr:sulfatase-like hydrolase/transferase [Fuerstiella sp.]
MVSSICTPSRASVMTGVHPLVHGVHCWQNKAPWNLPQLPELFAAKGYYTAAVGHYELGRGIGRGWHQQSDMGEHGPLYDALNFKYSHGRPDCGWSCGSLDCLPEEGHSDPLANRAIEMIEDACDSGAPFFVHVSFNDPHPPWFVPPPYDSAVDPARIELPDRGDDNGRPEWQFQALKECATVSATESDIRRVITVYYGMIEYVDAQIGRIYDVLLRLDILSDTWIVLSSDHGDFMGEKGLFEKCEVPYECLLHVPLLIAPPPGITAPRNETVQGLVQSVDLFTTMLSLAGLNVPDYTQGKDLMAWLRAGTR